MRKLNVVRMAGACLLVLGGGIQAGAYEVSEVPDSGTITGRVTFEGAVPAPKVFTVTRDPDVCGSQRSLQTVDVREGFLLKGTVVVLEGVKRGKPFASRTYHGDPPGQGEFRYAAGDKGDLQIRSKACNFGPVTGVVVPEASVEFANADPVTHTVHTYVVFGEDGRILRTVHNGDVFAESSMERTFTPGQFRKSQIVRIACDKHDFMQNWLYVVTTPYFSITDERGGFSIDGVPPGQYQLVAWHPALGLRKEAVTVGTNGKVDVHFGFSTVKK